MKLVHPEWKTQIVFREDQIQVVNIENPVYLTQIITELLEQFNGREGRFVLSDSDQLISLSKATEIILSPFQLDFRNRRIQNAILKNLNEVALEEEYLKTQELSSAIQHYVYLISDHLDYNVEFDETIEVSSLFKLANPRIGDIQMGLLAKLTDYICIAKKLLNLQLIVGVGFHNYFSGHELELLYKTVLLNKISLLLLDNCKTDERIGCENWLTIDQDLCEI